MIHGRDYECIDEYASYRQYLGALLAVKNQSKYEDEIKCADKAITEFFSNIEGDCIHTKYQTLFISACENNNMDIAQFILIKLHNNLNFTLLPVLLEKAFRKACLNGHLDMSKWIFDMKPNIDVSADNELLFHESCARHDTDMCEWILSTYKNL